MYNVFKRPMFKRGGSPTGTGIMSHVERRPNYSIGGGVTPRVNARFGFGNFLKGGDKYFSSPTKINTMASAGGPGVESIISQSMLEELVGNQNRNRIVPPRGSPYMGGVYAAAPIVAQTGLAYLNRPKTTEALKYMKGFDEGAITSIADAENALEYQAYAEELIKKDKQGKPISFTDAFFLDPETGTYPKFMGRTQDRQTKKTMEDELQAPGSPGYENRLREMEAEVEATALAKEEEAKELARITKAEAAAEKDAKYTESDILSSVEDEKRILDKILPANVSTSEKAFLIAKAMKGETLSDKLDIAGTEGTKLAKGKSARDREKALLAYKGATQKDLAKIAAGKKGFSEKQFEEMSKLKAISENTKLPEKVRNKALKDLASKQSVINMLSPKQTRFDATKTGIELNNYNKLISKIITKPKSDPNYQRDLNAILNTRSLLANVPEARERLFALDKILADAGILQFKKDGGRINYALGTENPMTTRPAVGQVPTEETSKLSFEDLRNRLPQEITDGVVRLISSSDQALQDFSYIRTQGDVVKFNQKYGVNLVLPAEA